MLIVKKCSVKSEFYDKNATVYRDSEVVQKGYVIYFHGGGLLYGDREDLPQLHLTTFTKAGYTIVAYDYPLAPATKLDGIMDDVISSINDFRKQLEPADDPNLPVFLFGRSAGAYLALIASVHPELTIKPAGIISFYGYGFLTDRWFEAESKYYNTLPKVPETCISNVPSQPHGSGDLETHFSLYVYARQTGKWKDLIYEGREKYFFSKYSLRLADKLPCPLLAAHSSGDSDVPFAEFLELCSRYSPERFIAVSDEHDFDRHEDDPFTDKLLTSSVEFMNKAVSQQH